MTPLEAQARKIVPPDGMLCPCDRKWCRHSQELYDAILAALLAVERETREADCGAICLECATGNPPVVVWSADDGGAGIGHNITTRDGEFWDNCDAEAIRALSGREEGK